MVRVPCACAHSDSEPHAAGEADPTFDAPRLIPAMHGASLFPSIGRGHGLIPRSKLISYLYVMDPEGKFVRGFAADAPTDYIAGVLRKLMDRSRGEARDGGLTDETKR